jgi:invasion protein IalB
MYNSLIIIFAVFFSMQAYVLAQGSNDLGTYGDWQATYWSNEGGICTMMTLPTKKEGKYSKRGEVYAQVVKNVGKKNTGVVNFVAGYTFKDDSEVNVKIDNKHSFTLFTNQSTAWTQTEKDDASLIKFMKLGNTMVVKGISSRGTNTKDTYSLKGFIAAFKAMNKKCK